MQHKNYNSEFDAMPWRYDGGTENRIRCGGGASVVRLQRVHHRCRRAQIVSILRESMMCLLPEYAMQKPALDQCQRNTQKKHTNIWAHWNSGVRRFLMPPFDCWSLFISFAFQMTGIQFKCSSLRTSTVFAWFQFKHTIHFRWLDD